MSAPDVTMEVISLAPGTSLVIVSRAAPCSCRAMAAIFVNRHGQTRCLACDEREVRRVH